MAHLNANPLLDSREGITRLLEWARLGGFVLQEYHEKLAKKYHVDTDGVIFSRPIPRG